MGLELAGRPAGRTWLPCVHVLDNLTSIFFFLAGPYMTFTRACVGQSNLNFFVERYSISTMLVKTRVNVTANVTLKSCLFGLILAINFRSNCFYYSNDVD